MIMSWSKFEVPAASASPTYHWNPPVQTKSTFTDPEQFATCPLLTQRMKFSISDNARERKESTSSSSSSSSSSEDEENSQASSSSSEDEVNSQEAIRDVADDGNHQEVNRDATKSGKCLSHCFLKNFTNLKVQRSAKVLVRGLVKFVPALA